MNCVLTAACGEVYTEILHVTAPSIEDFAKRCGAAFVSASIPKGKTDPREVMFLTLDMLHVYERVLWVDADCIVSPYAPNIFDLVPINGIGARFAGPHMMGGVVCFSNKHIGFLDFARSVLLVNGDGKGIGHNEVGLNAARTRLKPPIFELPVEWNYDGVHKVISNLGAVHILHVPRVVFPCCDKSRWSDANSVSRLDIIKKLRDEVRFVPVDSRTRVKCVDCLRG